MEFDTVMKKRASVREFAEKKPPMELVIEAIEAANLAPSPGNHAILRYVIVEDKERINKISEACQQSFIEQSSVIIVVCSDSKNAVRFYDKKTEKYVRHHAGAAVENLLLKITDLGLAACWVGAFSDFTIKDILKIPDDKEVEIIIPVGYQPKTSKTSQRKKPELDNRLFFEKYGQKRRLEAPKIRREDM